MLQPDYTNQYKYSEEVKRTIDMPNSIPFLRDTRNCTNQQWKKGAFATQDVFSPTVGRAVSAKRERRFKSKDLRLRKDKEKNWNNYIVPISKFNECVHRSNRIPFERI